MADQHTPKRPSKELWAELDSPSGWSAAFEAEAILAATKRASVLKGFIARMHTHPEIRGLATDGFGDGIRFKDHRYGWVRRGLNSLLELLDGPSVEVRFWACFAVGVCSEKRAIPRLQKLAATDHRHLYGWWSVAEEAQDALNSIAGLETPDRECTREERPRVYSWERT